MINKRDFKQARYSGFAEVGKIFSNAKRLEIIDALIQRPRSVEEISNVIEQSVASTSQHLQVLKRAQAVRTERQGTTIIYSLSEGTLDVFVAMRRLAETISPCLQVLRQQHANVPTITFEEVQQALEEETALLLDVRTIQEFSNGHMDGAVSMPLQDLPFRMAELSIEKPLIVTCRGPYCVSSDEAAKLLIEQGFTVSRYDDGVGEWCSQGGILCGRK
jgi:rhodanese-related sulfurtransferase